MPVSVEMINFVFWGLNLLVLGYFLHISSMNFALKEYLLTLVKGFPTAYHLEQALEGSV